MNAKHTQGPLRPGWVSSSGTYHETHHHMCGMDGEEVGATAANIDHMVACVNACEGINPAAVKELLDAARSLLVAESVNATHTDHNFFVCHCRECAKDRVRAALAKATGEDSQ